MSGRARRLVAVTTIAALAVLAPMPSAVAGVHQGRFRGLTEQGRRIVFRVNRNEAITFLRVVLEVPGPTGCVIEWDATEIAEPVRQDGTFVIRGEENQDTLVVRGEFVSRRKALGTAKTIMVGTCEGRVKALWTATRVEQPA